MLVRQPGQTLRVPGSLSSQISRPLTYEGGNLAKITERFSLIVPPSAAGCSRVVTRVETPGDES
jgi:hypothetical protein